MYFVPGFEITIDHPHTDVVKCSQLVRGRGFFFCFLCPLLFAPRLPLKIGYADPWQPDDLIVQPLTLEYVLTLLCWWLDVWDAPEAKSKTELKAFALMLVCVPVPETSTLGWIFMNVTPITPIQDVAMVAVLFRFSILFSGIIWLALGFWVFVRMAPGSPV